MQVLKTVPARRAVGDKKNMQKVYQTKFGKSGGNCFQACVASLFELELNEVPDFCNNDKEHWMEDVIRWLNKRGLSAVLIDTKTIEGDFWPKNYKDTYLLVGGKNQDGVDHEVIYYNGDIAHDPNPKTKSFTPGDMILIFLMNPADRTPKGRRTERCMTTWLMNFAAAAANGLYLRSRPSVMRGLPMTLQSILAKS